VRGHLYLIRVCSKHRANPGRRVAGPFCARASARCSPVLAQLSRQSRILRVRRERDSSLDVCPCVPPIQPLRSGRNDRPDQLVPKLELGNQQAAEDLRPELPEPPARYGNVPVQPITKPLVRRNPPIGKNRQGHGTLPV
jgi:hypothetical protein